MFVIGPLMDVLAESALYHRAPQQNIRDCPELGVKLQIFMVNFFSSLPEENRGLVLLQLIQRLGSRQWCAVPLLFLSQALSCLSPCPLLLSDGLHAFRYKLLHLCKCLCKIIFKCFVSCFISTVSLDEIFGFLAHFRADESLCRGTALWEELCNWLQTNEGRFLLTDGDLGSSELCTATSDCKGVSIFSYVHQRLKTFLAVPANSAEAELLTWAVLLTADLQKTRNEEPGLELLLQPLLDVLQRLSTNVYLVLHKTDKSLQLLLSLLRLHRRRSDTEQENEDVVAVALKTHMLSVGDSVQEFLLRRLSGELRENPSVPGQVQRAVGMATLALLCDVADRGVLKSQSEAMRSLYSLTDYFYPSSSSSSQHLNQTLLKPTTATVSSWVYFHQQMVQCEESLCVEAVCASWKVVQALSTNPHDFWSTLQGFVRLAFDHGLLQLTEEQNPSITACIQQILSELMELAQVRSGVFNVLIQHCCETWLPAEGVQSDAVFSTALLHLNILTEACVYGPVFRRDQRLVQEVQSYVEQFGDTCAANTAVSSDNRDDQFPRVCALAFLCLRYYSNSIQHRVKNRVWQTLLLLLHKLRLEFVSDCVLSHVCEAGFCSNQASVKYLIEWTLILILHLNPSRIQNLWNCFSLEHEKTRTSICTFFSVLVHLNVLFPKLQDKEVQWRRAVEVSLQWCFSHNFSVRLYALLALKRVWELEDARAMEENLGGLTTVVQACLQQAEAMQNTGNAMKNWSRIQEHFFFSAFHPIRDYSIETIFQTFPSLSELSEDEWLPLWKFESFVVFPMCAALPLKNRVRDLCELQPGDWIQQDKGVLEQDERWAEVQKKITPWKLSVQEQEPELMAQQRAARLGKLTSNLLVVASLIDKPTNLGGLCRTCEIFGAKALVLDSLRHINDKQFQALSVSSELWLPMLEVKPAELSDYLQLKKREGYWVIGVEQTSNSQSLQDYTFPERSLLLLGNEREGIPANLLQLVDVCVEIPQNGVTRSLNVHVSAALLVWEYTRQHLGQNPAAPRC
ncbi:unnamed protein product [Leuciscus chuanchicus]